MLNSSSRSSIAALTNAVQSMPYAPSVENESAKAAFWDANGPTHRVHAEIQKRDASQLNAGWITMDEIKQKTALSQSDVISGLRELFVHQTIESVPGNGQGNHRYRLIKTASVEFLEKPQNEKVESLRHAVAQEPKDLIKEVEPILLAAGKQPERLPSMSTKRLHDARTPVESKRIEAAAVDVAKAVTAEAHDAGDSQSHAPAAVEAPAMVQKRDARGHFLPMPGKGSNRTKPKPHAAAIAQEPGLQQESKVESDIGDAPKAGSTNVNRLQGTREVDGLLVANFERRPGGPSIALTLEDAVKLGQDAVKILMMQRVSPHH